MGNNIRNSLGANEEHLLYFLSKNVTSQLTTSHLFELAPGEEAVLVNVKPPEGLLHPVQPGPLLLLLGPRPPVLAGARGQATQEAVLKTGPLESGYIGDNLICRLPDADTGSVLLPDDKGPV